MSKEREDNPFVLGLLSIIVLSFDFSIGEGIMPKKGVDDTISIRVRLEKSLIDRLDKAVGEGNRQRFIRDAVEWRLDEELPPIYYELSEELAQLNVRVAHLEKSQSTSVFLGELNTTTNDQICADDLDRKLLAFFIRNEGGTTPELAEHLLGDSGKRRTILDRIDRLNTRAQELIGSPVLEYKKGFVKDKRGAWWLVDPTSIMT